MLSVLGCAAGVVLLSLAVYFRRGRGPGARWWVDDDQYAGLGSAAGLVVGGLPALGGIAVALALGRLGDGAPTALGGLMLIVAVLLGLAGMVAPRWLVPRWWRREQRALRERERAAEARARARR